VVAVAGLVVVVGAAGFLAGNRAQDEPSAADVDGPARLRAESRDATPSGAAIAADDAPIEPPRTDASAPIEPARTDVVPVAASLAEPDDATTPTDAGVATPVAAKRAKRRRAPAEPEPESAAPAPTVAPEPDADRLLPPSWQE
jgi:hypothetical protein